MTPDIRIFEKEQPTRPRESRLRTVLDDSHRRLEWNFSLQRAVEE